MTARGLERYSVYFLLIIITIYGAVAGQEDYSKWAHLSRIYLNTASSGVTLTNNMNNFPMLVRLNNSNFPFFDSVKTGGADIRFSNSAGGHLLYQIERWINNAGSNDTAEIWVKIDSVVPNDSLQHIDFYWGNGSVADSSDSEGVFMSSNGFSAVYHLAEDDRSGVGTANYYKDATGNNHHGFDSIISNTDIGGYIGHGHKFGCKDAIPVGTWNPSTTKITLSAWVKWLGDSPYWQTILSKRNDLSNTYWQLLFSRAIDPDGIGVFNGNAEQGFGAGMFSANTWHHIALTSQNGAANSTILYIDGVKAGVDTTFTWGNTSNTSARIIIGNNEAYRSVVAPDSGGPYWNGYLDEVRIESAAHSRDWINLCYQNQRATGQKLLTIRTKPIITIQPVSVVVNPSDTATFSTSAYGDSLSWQWFRSVDGLTWSIAPGITDTSIYYFKASQTDSKAFFRCIVTNDLGSDTSIVVQLKVCTPIAFTTQPANVLNCSIGKLVTFTVATTYPSYTFQWEKCSDNVTWTNVENATSSLYSFTTQAETKDGKYRCKITSDCDSARSDAANFTMRTKPIITIEPVGIIIKASDTATFSISAIGDSLSWQWFRSVDGLTWSIAPGITDTLIYRFKASQTDSKAFFRCIVTNDLGSDTSIVVQLKVCTPITLTTQPANVLNCPVGKMVTFTIATTDTSYTYQWEKSSDNVTWTNVESAILSLYSFTTQAGTNDGKYRCKIISDCDSARSDVANLTMCVPVTIALKPANQAVVEGKTASFVIGTSKSARSYQWYSKKSQSTDWNLIPDAIDTAYSVIAGTSDSGSLYSCIAKGTCDSVKSDSVMLTVYKKVYATFQLSDSVSQAPFTVVLTDSSTGNITKRIWNFGDTTIDSGTAAISLVHTYKTANTYTVKLIVSGPGGIDSISKTLKVYPVQGNPIIITGRMLTSDKIQLLYTNFSTIKTSFPSIPHAIGIKLFNRIGAIPGDTLHPVKMLKNYDPTAFVAHGNEYYDTVNVDTLSSLDSIYGFTTQIVWHDGKKTAIGSYNGCAVLMRNTTVPNNRLSLSGSYTPWDTANFVIDSIGTIDWFTVDSVALWYGIGADSIPDFSKQINVKKWNKQEFASAVVNGKLLFNVIDNRFNSERRKLNFAVVLIGKNKIKSLPVASFFNVGRLRPENTVTLQAHATNPNTIQLSWNKQSNIENLRIFYRTGESIPFDYSFTGLDSINPGIDSVSCTINQFNQKTRYYFGAQIFKDGMWSRVTPLSSASDSTPAAAPAKIINSIKIQNAYYDSLNASLSVSWTIDTSAGPNLQIGGSYTTISNKTGDSLVFKTADVIQAKGTTLLTFREAIEFDHDYTILLRLRRGSENWTDVTADSKTVIHIPPFGSQTVVYIFKPTQDSTLWANNTIKFTTPASNVIEPKTITVKISSFVPDPTYLKGFINVGNGFSFAAQAPSDSFTIGLKCFAIPAAFSIRDVRIYRFDGANFLLEPKTIIDSSGLFVSVKTADLYRPFIAMIDTQPPLITLISNRDTITNVNAGFQDTLSITDNVANQTWYYKCSNGGDPYFLSGYNSPKITISSLLDTVIVYSQNKFTSDDGARAIVYTFDGRTLVNLDLSRRVRINNCDTVLTSPLIWVPVKVTAILDTPTVSNAIKHIFKSTGTAVYDTRYMRLFHWSPSALNVNDTNKWVEYSPVMEKEFNLTSGQLFWIKTKDILKIDLGSGISMSFTDTVRIRLIPKNWTDFASPFHFDMKIGDIIAASRKYSPKVDSLQLYQWKINTISGRYSASPFFIPNLYYAGATDSTLIMSSQSKIGFTVWNPTEDTISLVFAPSLSVPDFKPPVLNKPVPNIAWAVKVTAKLQDGHTMSPIFCGLDERVSQTCYYPLPPSLEQISAGVIDISGRKCAHLIANKMQNGGSPYVLAFTNNSNQSQQITCTMESLGHFDPNAKIAVFNLKNKTWNYADSAGSITIEVEGGSTAYRQLLIGSDMYIHNFYDNFAQCKLALAKIYPNPIRSSVMIQYSLPFATVKKTDFIVVNMLGRIIWHKTDYEQSVAGGNRSFRWNVTNNNGEKIHSGLYILKMIAYNDKDKSIGQFDRMLTVLP